MTSVKDAIAAYPRGSEWRVWDLHIHTPASFHWEGAKFGEDEEENKRLVDDMIDAMNSAEPEVFAIMDYWTFDGWFRLQKRLAEDGAPILKKTVFPGIELRICTPTTVRLNAHVVFSDKIDDQHLRDFLSTLKLEIIRRPLSPAAIADYARKAGEDKLTKLGTSKNEISNCESKALAVGSKIAEITRESYEEAVNSVAEGMALAFMPFSTSDGLEKIDWNEHYAFTMSLFTLPPIFEARKYDQWAAFAGVETEGNKKWFRAFQDALSGKARLAVSGSDAHRFVGKSGSNDSRGYGDFPSGKKTWIKANPTWEGLHQAIKEPANRSYIGESPAKLVRIDENKTFYIDRLAVRKNTAPPGTPNWLANCDLVLNPDLVAIIGNKGSGKSALADIIALLGQSQQKAYFSFLRKDRFRGKSGEPAKFFEGELTWISGNSRKELLSDDPEPELVELVRYIPQGRFEALCNDHVSGKSNEFEKELRSVIFAHVPQMERTGSSNFEELIDRLEEGFRKDLAEQRKAMSALNEDIANIENQLNPIAIKNVDEQLKLVKQQREAHVESKPKQVAEPTEQLTPIQLEIRDRIVAIDERLEQVAQREADLRGLERKVTTKKQSAENLRRKVSRLEEQYKEYLTTSQMDAANIRVASTDLVSFDVRLSKVEKREKQYQRLLQQFASERANLQNETQSLSEERQEKAKQLAEPQQLYQSYLLSLRGWQAKLEEIEGSSDDPESLNGILARIDYLKELPERCNKLKGERRLLVASIFKSLEAQRKIREGLFAPLQSVIQSDVLIQEEYQLTFQAKLEAGIDRFSSQLFDLVKQHSGPLRGEDKSLEAVRTIFEAVELRKETDAVTLSENLDKLLDDAARNVDEKSLGLGPIMRKDRSVSDVYDHIFGLRFIEPKYTLLFQETQIEHLSPGQRGALLLIFYLLVDKGRNPIVLDQPEENLDNQTIVSLLVPVLDEAKKSRQIFMVTHNPNLAVVCDAEQIIHATFSRKGGPEIHYTSGAIEDPGINEKVVNVLEGTKRAFDNRGNKYH
ncbi:TrlF family AAA-like ATPase [Shimia sp. SDUM112013]|uniref:TrlF family AAA-like ATPase n=1 Tax=Shimia sp. SDUM112013 TaxID=3136160 RepID=UPI0032EF0EA5